MRGVNILQVNSSLSEGGREIHPLILAKRLMRRGHRVLILCQPDSAIAHWCAGQVPTREVRMRGYVDPLGIWRISRILRQERIQVVDVHLSSDLWTVVPAVRMTSGARILLGKHVGSRRAKADPLHRWLHHSVDRVLAVSQTIRRNVMETCRLSGSKVQTLHWGLELEKFVPHPQAGDEFRRELGLAPDIPVVGVVGRLTPRKGHREFLQAARMVSQSLPQARFLVVGRHSRGESSFEEQMRDLCARLDLQDRVIFTGHREDIPRVMAALDVLVVPSYWEAFGWVTMEAMAMARPVVATAGGGTQDLVVDGETGLLVPPRNAERLGQAILDLLRDRAARERMGLAGRLRVEAHFTIDKTADSLEAIMEEILGNQEAHMERNEYHIGGI